MTLDPQQFQQKPAHLHNIRGKCILAKMPEKQILPSNYAFIMDYFLEIFYKV